MKQQNLDKYFTGKMFRRQYFPALISAIVLSFGDVADGLVLGNSVGYIGLAAIALTMPVCQIFNVIMNGLGIGGCVRFSQKMASGHSDTALAEFQGVITVTAVLGVIIALLGNLLVKPLLYALGAMTEDGALFEASLIYLRVLLLGTPMLFLNYVLNYYMKNDDMEKQASLAFTVGNIVDISLNVVLVLVLRMGVAGASLATVAGQTVGVVISIVVICRRDCTLKLTPFKPDFSNVALCFRKGFYSSVEFLYSMVFLLLANRLLLRTVGDIGVAILDLVLSVSYFMFNLNDAAAKSILPVTSTYYGEQNEDGMRLSLMTGLRYAVCSGSLLALFIFFFPNLICRFFGLTEPLLLETGWTALRVFAVSIPLTAICSMVSNYDEACERERDTLVLNTMRGVLPIALALFFLVFDPDDFWLLYPLTEALSLAVFAIYKRMVHTPPFERDRIFRKTIYSNTLAITDTTQEIEAFCERWDLSPRQQYSAAMALEEICVAMLDNGFRGSENGFIQITLIAREDGELKLHIRDNAASFNPLAMEMDAVSVDGDSNLDALGIMAIKKKAKGFAYRRYQGFNTVSMRF